MSDGTFGVSIARLTPANVPLARKIRGSKAIRTFERRAGCPSATRNAPDSGGLQADPPGARCEEGAGRSQARGTREPAAGGTARERRVWRSGCGEEDCDRGEHEKDRDSGGERVTRAMTEPVVLQETFISLRGSCEGKPRHAMPNCTNDGRAKTDRNSSNQ
jgi:hypothetical protein